jgi:hypothetical protein
VKQFRIYFQGIQSSLFKIGPATIQSFGVAVDPRLARIGAAQAAMNGEQGGAELNECVTPPW